MTDINTLLPVIRSQFSKLKLCSTHDKVYKDECIYSFDSPYSEGGLYVNISTLHGFGADYVLSDVRKGGKLYLHQKWIKILKPKPTATEVTKTTISTLLNIPANEDEKYDIIKTHSLAVAVNDNKLEIIPLPNQQLPEFVSNVIQSIIDHEGMKANMQSGGSWDPNDVKIKSKYARNLIQLPTTNITKISQDPTTWKCAESGDTHNLWLNLSTGYIGGGRKNWDGTGGSGAALKHFQATGGMYPLCVKLGTITANSADVWSYAPDEDCLVIDPLLPEHLSHWGIDIMKLEKTDKSLLEMEDALNLSYDWSKMMEGGEKLELLRGPGLIGLQNIGSSCYLSSVMQTLLSIEEVQTRYLHCKDRIIETAPAAEAVDDFSTQMSKLAVGLLTDKYCPPHLLLPKVLDAGMDTEPSPQQPPPATTATDTETELEIPDEYRIAPRMFKCAVAKGNNEFMSGRQQDASEYFMHLLQVMSRAERISFNQNRFVSSSNNNTSNASSNTSNASSNTNNSNTSNNNSVTNNNNSSNSQSLSSLSPLLLQPNQLTSSLFEFETETRYQCTVTQQVKYKSGRQQGLSNIMEVRIPLEEAVNKEEVQLFQQQLEQERKKQKMDIENDGNDGSNSKNHNTIPDSDSNMMKMMMKSDTTHLLPSSQLPSQSSPNDIKLIIPFTACLNTYFGDEVIDMRNPSVNQGLTTVPTVRSVRMKSFPKYLMLKLGRYYAGPNWVQVKVDARVAVPETLDLTAYRSTGLQAHEILIPEDTQSENTSNTTNTTMSGNSGGSASAVIPVQPDEDIVTQLVSMGFSEHGSRRAAVATQNADVEVAMGWVLEHMEDDNFNEPMDVTTPASVTAPVRSSSTEPSNTVELKEMICAMGYTTEQATVALKATDYNIERAMDWIFSHVDDLDVAVMNASTASNNDNNTTTTDSTNSSSSSSSMFTDTTTMINDGEGKYTLQAMISHIGKNTDHGHFLCHIKKGNHGWVLFNDEKVARSVNPPLEYGFMYLYRRND